MTISVRALRKSFPRIGHDTLVVLDGVDIDVYDGEFVTLLGPTGCGKTTLLKIMAGIEKADSGEIKKGSDFSVGSVPIVWQEHRLFPWRTVMQNVSFPLELSKIHSADAKQHASASLRAVGLDEFFDYYPWQLSEGMAQRVAIARALVTSPRCILMDEPFASIDYQRKQALFKQVQELRRERHLTIVYVTHDLRDAIQFSDRIIVLTNRPTHVLDVLSPTSADLPRSKLEEQLSSLLDGVAASG